MDTLRPIKLEEFKGKEKIKNNLKIYLESVKKTGKTLDHCLFYGLAGTGKTTLAFIIANELNSKIKIIQGNSLQKNIDIINIALTLNEGDVLFIDEIHAINPQIIEMIYSIMEDFTINIQLGKELNSRITKLKIPHFTLIGATTNLGKLPTSLEDRFGINIFFDQYSKQEIIEIVSDYLRKINLHLSNNEIKLIADNTKGIPRIANKIVRRVHDFKIVNPNITIREVLKNIDIISDGINRFDMQYLLALNNSEKEMGIRTISQLIGLDEFTIETKIEPFLISNNYVNKTNKGRILTKKGKLFLKNI